MSSQSGKEKPSRPTSAFFARSAETKPKRKPGSFAGYASPRVALEALRAALARADALFPLSVLGLLAGIVAGIVIVAFRLVSENALVLAGSMDNAENFEALSPEWRLVLPTAGGLAIGLAFRAVRPESRSVGPAHVMAQLARHAGWLPWRNAVMQFFGGAVSIACGHSVGREGPVIHLGATSASLFGQWLRLPNNSIRTLVACGVAGSIAASFNTPIAGVVFAMEVVLLEYTLAGFAPVILAAMAAAAVSRIVYGPDPAFAVPPLQLTSLLELPYVVLLGVVVGCLAAAYVRGTRTLDLRSRRLPLALRTTAAGAITGLCALVAPQVMGLGYDTVQSALLGQFGLAALVTIALLKLVATIACGGLGIPGGLIGPMVVMGATAGGALGLLGEWLLPQGGASAAFYATLGVVAMMGASLHAPLAALMAILELTANPHTLLPGMAAVIPALLVARSVFGQEAIFVALLRGRGLDYRFDPVALSLERTGVSAVMNRRFARADLEAQAAVLGQVLATGPDWLLVTRQRDVVGVVRPPPLDEGREDHDPSSALERALRAAPRFIVVSSYATLREAMQRLDQSNAELALVCEDAVAGPGVRPGVEQVRGVLERAALDRHSAR
ncbi:MAG: chloride channel protein [Burkholderiaceae bacterium]|nr:chloride channel protein [Burkholderiaceae bacterium]